MKTARKMTLLLVIAILALPISALAREDGAPTSALGMADAIRSNASGISGLYFNPAGMSQMFLYSLESGYTF
ncbi:MAG: hypothetical protein KC609_23615, partial [Myxococcales bacterium]|nr:hypothetical protein [Myxococcales bacterium]